jgi:hypothetical protein
MFDKRKQRPELLSSLQQFSVRNDTLAARQAETCVEYGIRMPKQSHKVYAVRTVGPGKPVFA